jgi:DNA-binding response OmpR family regulator
VARILVVDDDEQIQELMRDMLQREGHEVSIAANGREAMTAFDTEPVDLIIMDLIMPEQEGLETISALRKQNREIGIIAISGGGRVTPGDYLEAARIIGANRTFAKPFARRDILAAVSELV